MDWFSNPMTHPVTQYGLLAAAMTVCLYLFLTLKAEIQALRRRVRRHEEATGFAFAEVRAALTDVRTAVVAVEQIAQTPAPPPMLPSASINLTKRSQVLRMAKRGERAEQIAATLRVPQNEVDLLLKVQRAVLRVM